MSTRLRLCRIAILLFPLLFWALTAASQVRGEYFWNADPGIGCAHRMANNGEADGYSNFTVDAAGLTPGMNLLGMRAFSGGRWTHTIYSLVIIEAAPMATVWSGEYYWDIDPGVRKATPLPAGSFAGDVVVADLDAAGLDAGTHTLGLRVNSGGAWSHTRTYIVSVPAQPLAADWRAEYFWDTDPGVGKATPMPLQLGAAGGMVDVDLLTDGLTAGRHTIGFRTCSGRAWSTTVTAIVVVADERSAEISGAEYFWGADPGFGKGTPVAVSGGTEAEVELKDIDFPAETADEYVLSFRARSPQGWGTTVTRVIPHLYVESIALTAESTLVAVGTRMKVQSEVTPADAFISDLTWTTSDAAVATVAQDGTVTGIAPGTVTITSTSTDGSGKSATCVITVVNAPSSGVVVNPSDVTLCPAETAMLTATVLPATASQAVRWSSSDASVATVDASGRVTALKAGVATITATTTDSKSMTGECRVTVLPPLAVSITLSNKTLSLRVRDDATLTATVNPAEAEQTVVWASSDPAIVRVSSNGAVKALAEGAATITASTTDGSGVTASCSVTVATPLAESIALDFDRLVLDEEETAQLTAIILPAEAEQTARFSSSDAAVTTVDESGLVTAVAHGTAVIFAATTDGTGLTAVCVVTVNEKSGIAEVTADDVTVTMSGSDILIGGVADGVAVKVIDASGAVVYDGYRHCIGGLSSGFHIVLVGTRAYKVVLK